MSGKKRVAVVGAGGHGREIADFLSRLNDVDVIGYLDDNERSDRIDGLPVLGPISALDELHGTAIIIAIGNPLTARAVLRRVEEHEPQFATAIARSAVVSAAAEIAPGTAIFPNAVVGPGTKIGSHCTINVGATVSHDSVLADHVNVNPGAHLAGSVRCGEGAFIGMGANVLQGRTVGAWATIGAGAVVLSDVPEGATVVGVPARVVRDNRGSRRA